MTSRRTVATGFAAATAAVGLLVVGGAPALAACSGSSCQSQTATVTAVIGGSGVLGTRTLDTISPVALTGTSSLPTGTVSATVTETAATGDNPWSVTLQSSALTPSSGTGSIPADDLTLANTGLPTGTGCLIVSLSPCTVTAGATGTLGTAQTLFTVTGEGSAAYTGVYTGTGSISMNQVPNGLASGTYSGTLTATLIQ
jgi:hypothetical protein